MSPEDRAGLPARQAALAALLRIEQSGAWVTRLDPSAAGALDPRQRRQATDYVAGITRQHRWFDFLIGCFYHGQAQDLEPEVRQVLRLALYDLLIAGRPAHAAVSQAVELVRLSRPRAAGLVNAILRATLRALAEGLPEPGSGDLAADLAIRHSHPDWLVRRWLARFGELETRALLDWNNARPLQTLRVNPLRADRDMIGAELDRLGLPWQPGRWLDDALRLRRLQGALASGLVSRGWCAVQDEAAALVVRVLDPQPGERIIDGCAAPGGKALYAAGLMGDRGTVLAVDRHPKRLALLEAAAERQGIHCVRTWAGDLRALSTARDADGRPLDEPADRVLLDAPCSGTGVLAKRADLRWQRSPESLAQLTALQDSLLDAAAERLRPGGLLVYATCSLEPEENGQRVAAFLERRRDFRLEPLGALLSFELQDAAGCFESLPQRQGMDGAFAARLRRSDAPPAALLTANPKDPT